MVDCASFLDEFADIGDMNAQLEISSWPFFYMDRIIEILCVGSVDREDAFGAQVGPLRQDPTTLELQRFVHDLFREFRSHRAFKDRHLLPHARRILLSENLHHLSYRLFQPFPDPHDHHIVVLGILAVLLEDIDILSIECVVCSDESEILPLALHEGSGDIILASRQYLRDSGFRLLLLRFRLGDSGFHQVSAEGSHPSGFVNIVGVSGGIGEQSVGTAHLLIDSFREEEIGIHCFSRFSCNPDHYMVQLRKSNI